MAPPFRRRPEEPPALKAWASGPAPAPVVRIASVEPDGDGWGWENEASLGLGDKETGTTTIGSWITKPTTSAFGLTYKPI
jgi:hypothetical protein